MSIFRKYTFKYFIKERGIMPTVYSQIVQGNNHTHTHTHGINFGGYKWRNTGIICTVLNSCYYFVFPGSN